MHFMRSLACCRLRWLPSLCADRSCGVLRGCIRFLHLPSPSSLLCRFRKSLQLPRPPRRSFPIRPLPSRRSVPLPIMAPVEVRSFTLLTPLPQAQVDSLRYGPRRRRRSVCISASAASISSPMTMMSTISTVSPGRPDSWACSLSTLTSLPLQLEAAVTARLVDHAYQQNVTGSSTKVARKDKIQQYNVSVPILFTCRPLNSRIFFLFGPQMDFGVYDHLKIYKDGNKIVNEDLIDDDARENVDWDIVMGLGVRLRIISVRFPLRRRYFRYVRRSVRRRQLLVFHGGDRADGHNSFVLIPSKL